MNEDESDIKFGLDARYGSTECTTYRVAHGSCDGCPFDKDCQAYLMRLLRKKVVTQYQSGILPVKEVRGTMAFLENNPPTIQNVMKKLKIK